MQSGQPLIYIFIDVGDEAIELGLSLLLVVDLLYDLFDEGVEFVWVDGYF